MSADTPRLREQWERGDITDADCAQLALERLDALAVSDSAPMLALIRKECSVDDNGDPVGQQPAEGWETGYCAGVRHVFRALKGNATPQVAEDSAGRLGKPAEAEQSRASSPAESAPPNAAAAEVAVETPALQGAPAASVARCVGATWIPIEERSPALYDTVAICGIAMRGTGFLFSKGWHSHRDELRAQDITHWMPLPLPPERPGK